jgi:comEA protein
MSLRQGGPTSRRFVVNQREPFTHSSDWRISMRYLSLFVAASLAIAVLTGAARAADQDKPSPPAKTSTASASGAPVNLNSATVAQLEKLPGIGNATAQRIVDYRQKNGNFKKVEELMNVKGIGEKSFLKIKPLITVAADKGDRPGGQQ